MVRTLSTMLELGTNAPDFALPDTDGRTVRRSDFDGQPLLVVFLCNHCPYVQHIRGVLAERTKAYLEQGVAVVGVNSNDVDAYPDDAPDAMKEERRQVGYAFPYLFDADQSVAKAYRAACTPDLFLFDKAHRLVYRGQFDDARPRNEVAVTGADLDEAVARLLRGTPQVEMQKPSMGCNIKWKPGNQPDYFHG